MLQISIYDWYGIVAHARVTMALRTNKYPNIKACIIN